MRICLIAEGCYPYVAGGVSSWIQMLLEGMSEHEFIIYTIGAESKMRGKYKYKIPSNVIKIEEHFLDEFYSVSTNKKGKNVRISQKEQEALKSLVSGADIHWDVLFDLFSGNPNWTPIDFLMSNHYLDAINVVAREKYTQISFLDIFWTIRSMLLPLLSIISSDIVEADIYHSVSTGYAGVIGSLLKYKTGKPFIVTEHGIYTREREEEILKAKWVDVYFKQLWIDFFSSMSLLAYSKADIVTALFSHARVLQNELGADYKKCRVIPNGISMEKYKNVPALDVKRDEFVIGAIVRVVPIKDIKTLIYSFDMVKSEMPNAVLYIIGPTDESEEYYLECQELIENLGVKDIHFTGRINVAEWMGKLDVVVLSSISEGQPFVLLEAMASKRPVVSTDVGSCRELIEGDNDNLGDCGYVVPVMNPSAMARALVRLGKDRNKMIELGEIGAKRVKCYYTIEKFLETYKELYKEVG